MNAIHCTDTRAGPGAPADVFGTPSARARGGSDDGPYSAEAGGTVNVPVARLFDAFLHMDLRERWLPGAMLHLRAFLAERSARFDWKNGPTRVHVVFTATGASRSEVALMHERLPDARTAAELEVYWRGRMVELKALLERLKGPEAVPAETGGT